MFVAFAIRPPFAVTECRIKPGRIFFRLLGLTVGFRQSLRKIAVESLNLLAIQMAASNRSEFQYWEALRLNVDFNNGIIDANLDLRLE